MFPISLVVQGWEYANCCLNTVIYELTLSAWAERFWERYTQIYNLSISGIDTLEDIVWEKD